MIPKILFIIPAYNEEVSILKTIREIHSFNPNWDIIVINDGSTDRTKEILDENNIPSIHLIMNLGIGGAVQTGYKYAAENDYDIAIQFDGDGQHNINDVEKLIEPLLNDMADFVVGSRFLSESREGFQSSFLRRIGIVLIAKTIGLLSQHSVSDPTSGFRAANKRIIHFFSSVYPIEFPEPESLMILHKLNYRVKEVPSIMNERQGGKSSIHSWISAYYMLNVLFSLWIVSLRKYDKY